MQCLTGDLVRGETLKRILKVTPRLGNEVQGYLT